MVSTPMSKVPASFAAATRVAGFRSRCVAPQEGEGDAVVCVHGLGGSTNTFTPLMPALARAHSTADPSEGAAGDYLRTAFRDTHGCMGSATTAGTGAPGAAAGAGAA